MATNTIFGTPIKVKKFQYRTNIKVNKERELLYKVIINVKQWQHYKKFPYGSELHHETFMNFLEKLIADRYRKLEKYLPQMQLTDEEKSYLEIAKKFTYYT